MYSYLVFNKLDLVNPLFAGSVVGSLWLKIL
jgi:hypothetical protein